jgi:DNA-binding NarL/FixJ family response regulator
VRLILQGISNKVIAAELFISERTVKAHLTSIFKKLHIPDRLHLAILLKGSESFFE